MTGQRFFYVASSALGTFLAIAGVMLAIPMLYTTLPGLLGLATVVVSGYHFLVKKRSPFDFVTSLATFGFYQAFALNPITATEFVREVGMAPKNDAMVGLALSNAMLGVLIVMTAGLETIWGRAAGSGENRVPSEENPRLQSLLLRGFMIAFAIVALPNILYGNVIMGALKSMWYQRALWDESSGVIAYNTTGASGSTIGNLVVVSPSLFLLWLSLLRTRYKRIAWTLAPLVLIWTGGTIFQGSRTFLVGVAIAVMIYILGDARTRRSSLAVLVTVPAIFLAIQLSTQFRASGLVDFRWNEFGSSVLVVRGNESALNQIDGVQFFREYASKMGDAANPVLGLAKGMILRPLEGALIWIPRAILPMKPVDAVGDEFNLWVQTARLGGGNMSVATMGASAGFFGRDLIRFGVLGPISSCFWLSVVAAAGNWLFSQRGASPTVRCLVGALSAFFVAQCRDFVPMWFLPFFPAIALLAWAHYSAREIGGRSQFLPRHRAPAFVPAGRLRHS